MPRKKPSAPWNVDPVQPLTISAAAGGRGESEPTDILRFTDEQFAEVLAHLNLEAGPETNTLKRRLEDLCASATRTKFQDEDGPKRGDRMVAMQQFSVKIDRFEVLLFELSNSGSSSLHDEIEAIIIAKWKPPGAAFESTTNLTAVLKHLSRSLPRLAKVVSSNILTNRLDRLAEDSLSLAVMIQAGGDAMHPMFMHRSWEQFLTQKKLTGEYCNDHVMLLLSQLIAMRSASDELLDVYKAVRGATKATTLPELQLRLAYLYELHTGKKFTHSPYGGYSKYIGKPMSHGGQFVKLVLGALLLTRDTQIASGLRDVVKRLKDENVRVMLDKEISG